MRTLTAPSSSRSRLTVPWVATMPSVARSSTSWTFPAPLQPFRQLGQHGPVRMHAVPGRGPHGRGRTVEHLVGDLLAPPGGQAVQEDTVRSGGVEEGGVHL